MKNNGHQTGFQCKISGFEKNCLGLANEITPLGRHVSQIKTDGIKLHGG